MRESDAKKFSIRFNLFVKFLRVHERSHSIRISQDLQKLNSLFQRGLQEIFLQDSNSLEFFYFSFVPKETFRIQTVQMTYQNSKISNSQNRMAFKQGLHTRSRDSRVHHPSRRLMSVVSGTPTSIERTASQKKMREHFKFGTKLISYFGNFFQTKQKDIKICMRFQLDR